MTQFDIKIVQTIQKVKDIQRSRTKTVIKYEFDKPVDTLENIKWMLYANKLTVHDAFNKTIKDT